MFSLFRKKQQPKLQPKPQIPAEVKAIVFKRDRGRCRNPQCSVPGGMTSDQSMTALGRPLEFDHYIPRSWGGDNTVSNVQLLCQPCNNAKSNKSIGTGPGAGPQPQLRLAVQQEHRRAVARAAQRRNAVLTAAVEASPDCASAVLRQNARKFAATEWQAAAEAWQRFPGDLAARRRAERARAMWESI